MEGVGNSQQLASNAEAFEPRYESRHCVTRARDDRVLWAVQRGDRNVRAVQLLDRRRYSLGTMGDYGRPVNPCLEPPTSS